MEIRTLQHADLEELTNVFNRSFENYFVPFELSLEQLKRKLAIDEVDLLLSAGAYSDDKLVAFILHGIDSFKNERTAYNTGTGVLPDHRGRQLTQKLYTFLEPGLRSHGISRCLLEVIDVNAPAIRSYKKCGYVIQRELVCHKGIIQTNDLPSSSNIRQVDHPNLNQLSNLRDWEPAWQNSDRTISHLKGSITHFGYFQEDELLGYICLNEDSGSVYQFAVAKEFRRRGIARSLFDLAGKRSRGKISMINMDGGDQPTSSFLNSLGLKAYLTQYEMERDIK